MIHFEITACPDLNTVAPFKFHQNQIYLGRSSGDLWIKDSLLLPIHIMLEVIENDLLIHPQKGVEFYLLNGKRSSSIRKLKIDDNVQIGNTTFKVIAFHETIFESKKNILNKKLNSLIEEGSQRLSVIEKLTKLMKQ